MTFKWNPPANWLKVETIEAHTCGEPLRVIVDGFPNLPGTTILEKRRLAQTAYDEWRRALMWEPRGHADMYGCILTEPVTDDGDVGVLFLHNEGFSTMCGHGIIGLTKVGLDTGLIKKDGERPELRIDSPAGRVTAYADRQDGVVQQVSFDNVPSFVYARDQGVLVDGLGMVRYDVAFGGAFYAFVEAADLQLELNAGGYRQLIDYGQRIKAAVMDSLPIYHPFEPDLGFLYGVIFVGPAENEQHHSRNVCVFADGEVDRCPTGTGVSARAALHHARQELALGEVITIESILGTTFSVEVVAETQFGTYGAVIPRVTGTAHIMGQSSWLIDPTDPLRSGFLLR